MILTSKKNFKYCSKDCHGLTIDNGKYYCDIFDLDNVPLKAGLMEVVRCDRCIKRDIELRKNGTIKTEE
jgi:hypothetical protein